MNEKQNLCITQGASASYVFDVKNIDGGIFDLNGWALRCDVKISPAHRDAFIELPVLITDAGAGKIMVVLTSFQTGKLMNCEYCYSVRMYRDQVILDAVSGKVFTCQGVTR